MSWIVDSWSISYSSYSVWLLVRRWWNKLVVKLSLTATDLWQFTDCNNISHVLQVMTLSYQNSNNSYPICYFTSSGSYTEPAKINTESQIPLCLHFQYLVWKPISQCWWWEYLVHICIWKWLSHFRASCGHWTFTAYLRFSLIFLKK